MTKPLQGKNFFEFIDGIMGISKTQEVKIMPEGKKGETRSHKKRIWSLIK